MVFLLSPRLPGDMIGEKGDVVVLSHECERVLSKFSSNEQFSLEDVEAFVGNRETAVSVIYFLEKGDYILCFALPGRIYKISELGKGYLKDKSMQRKTACYALIAAIAAVLTLIATVLTLIW
jgi:hypothetical protein